MSLKGLLQLLSGNCLFIIPQRLRADTTAMCRFFEKHGIDAFDCTPSQLEMLLSAGLLDNPRYRPASVLIGGEAISHTTWEQLRAATSIRFFNMYGPTEATVDATLCEINGSSLSAHIGGPIANVRTYILDSRGQPTPLGVAGEIHIGGVGVARGYLNLPQLTDERFIDDVFSDIAGARLYKTGDLGRWRSDGVIEYVGRNDFQVKIRGFRIELGEIEAKLRTCPGVRDAVVVAREDRHGGKRLVAYLLPRGDASLDIPDLRRHLAATLADFMVPSALQVLQAFPINANGKLDRNALPAPDLDSVQTGTYEAPQGQIEATLAEIWKDLLELEQVGRNDDFFELGGHSLLAIQLLARVHESLGVELGLRELFGSSHSKLREFAMLVHNHAPQHANLTPIRTSGNAKPLFLVHPGEGEVGYARALAPWLDSDVPIYGLAASGFLEGKTPHSTVEEMASCYIKAMREIQPGGPYRVAGWSAGGTIAYEIAHQLLAADEHVDFLGLLDTTSAYPPMPALAVSATQAAAVTPDHATTLLVWLSASVPSCLLDRLQPTAAANDIEAILACCQAEGVLPQDVPVATLHRHVMVRHAIATAVRRYVRAPMPLPIFLFSASGQERSDPTLGWRAALGSRLHHRPVDGTHRTMVELPHLSSLGESLSQALQEASGFHRSVAELHYNPRIVIRGGSHKVNPLFCIPGAGANVAAFAELSQVLKPGIAMHGLQPRGLCGVMLPHLDVPSAARAYLQRMREVAPRGPYKLLGHSHGGWIACEIARKLAAEGERVGALILLDTDVPERSARDRKTYSRVEALVNLVRLYEMSLEKPMGLTVADFSALEDEQQLALLLSRLIDVGIMPARAPLQTLRGIVRVFCSSLNSGYAPETNYDGMMHIASVIDECGYDGYLQRRAAWQAYAPNSHFWVAPGNHITMLNAPHVGALVDWMQPILVSP